MITIIAPTVLILAAGCAAPFLNRRATRLVALAISGIALAGLILTLFEVGTTKSIAIPGWMLPYGQLTFGLDGLTKWFLAPLFLLTACTSYYGRNFQSTYNAGYHWMLYSLLAASMIGVLASHNGIPFLLSWEVMSVTSFLLIPAAGNDKSTLHAAWVYFIATHIGTIFIVLSFLLMFRESGSFDFEAWAQIRPTAGIATTIFVCAVIGFGTKAGLFPFHVWMPIAYPAAPPHVSALMSAVLVKIGLYGIFRVLSFLHPWQAHWGTLLCVLGGVSGIMGVLFSLAQTEIKRLLAFSSVENIGIILLSLGLAVIGVTHNLPLMTTFAVAGALFHIWIHAIVKGLLFLLAGSILHATGTGDLDRLGGLLRRMPLDGILFLVGTLSICGLPLFSGFISEALILRSCLQAVLASSVSSVPLFGLGTAMTFALIGGFAAVGFSKAFGVAFLGEPRSSYRFTHSNWSTRAPLCALALCSLVIGMAGFLLLQPLGQALASMIPTLSMGAELPKSLQSLSTFLGLVAGSAAVMVLMYALIERRHPARHAPTWDCGYIKPTPRMQYTSSSFSLPAVSHFGKILKNRIEVKKGEEPFPAQPWSLESTAIDWVSQKIYTPLITRIDTELGRLRWLQSGKTGHYVLFIALTLVGLIVWKFYL